MSYQHSYYPKGVEIPNYVPNEWSTLTLISMFAAACVIVLTTAKAMAINANSRITSSELSKALWSTLCGCIHLFLEGFYAMNFATLQGSQHVLAQLWKEYSLSDSRYLTSDSFVMCMESVTAWCWGPLSFLLAYYIVTDHPFRHPLQIIISTGQLYGDVLYYATFTFNSLVHGVEHSRPEAYYFYGYYVLMNGFWIVIPGFLIADSVRACGQALTEVKKMRSVGMNVQAKRKS
ncbi:EBDP4, emopamil-binding protein [Astrocystis sublimbata]|nr:EBDP4, emopamil-binding protein [Astrocystis sublimbata]